MLSRESSLLTLPFLQTIFNFYSGLSPLDNRNLNKFPEVKSDLESLKNLTTGIEYYYNDHFGFRNELILSQVLIDSFIFDSNLKNYVNGRRNMFFVIENITIDDFRGLARFSKEKSDTIIYKLNKIDKSNGEIIWEIEQQNPNKENVVSAPGLKGIWLILSVMPSGWARNFRFYEDGRFEFRYNNMRELPLIHSFSGRYKVKGNQLILSIYSRNIFKHNNKIIFSGGYGHKWENAKLVIEELPKVKNLKFPISKIQYNKKLRFSKDEIERIVIKIGGIVFYKMYNDPDEK